MGVRPKDYCQKCHSNPCCCSNDITFNPTINVNPVINIPSPPVNGGNGEQGLVTEFQIDQPSTIGRSVDIDIPEGSPAREIASISVTVDNISSRVWLNSTVGWVADAVGAGSDVNFNITRTRPGGTEETIFSTEDRGSIDSGVDVITTSFTFVDETPILTAGPQLVQYRLVVFHGGQAPARVIGPIIFTGAEIRANTP